MLQEFLKQAEQNAFDPKHRRTMNFNIGKYDEKVKEGKLQYADLEKARRLAKNVKWYALEHLERHLLQFEEAFTSRGGKVIWAETAEDAAKAVVEIALKHDVKTSIKSKSMVTEEIHLNAALEKAGIESLETDLGEYIVQLEDSRPYHIVTPIMQKSAADVAALFHKKFNTPPHATATDIAHFVRALLRNKFAKADLGITGANFIIADSGAISLTENEGNARLSMSLPRVHIAIAGIEKVIPTLEHLDLFLPLLATHGTGQGLTVYNSIVSGAKSAHDIDGPEAMYVILLDNGRSKVLADATQRESLYCIRCGACLNVCPVYKNIGGHAYEAVYPGPIGSVLMPNIDERSTWSHLSNASSLCGSCSAACPVHINLHDLLLDNRHHEKLDNLKPTTEKTVWDVWRRIMLSRFFMNTPSWAKQKALNYFFQAAWGERRELPQTAKKTFNQLWKNGKV